jgi:DnaJ-class molecular chaperone
LGTSIDVPTIDGTVKRTRFRLEPRTATKIRMKGYGAPALKGSGTAKGDQFVKINVNIPKKLTDKHCNWSRSLQMRALGAS